MAIRKLFFLSLVAAGAAHLSVASSAVAQQPTAPHPAGSPEDISAGLIMSADDFMLGPGETIVSGDPELGIRSGLRSAAAFPHHDAGPPDAIYGDQPLLAPPPGYGAAIDCPGCEPGYYLTAEALYFKRSGDEFFTRSDQFALGEMDYEWGGRLTLGRRFDCVNGYEAIYAGPLRWEQDNSFVSAGGGINTFIDVAPLDPDLYLSAFIDAESQRQNFQADLDSLEFNRTYFGWDVVKALIGIRTMLYDEEYNYTSRRNLGGGDFESGRLRQKSENFLIGPQLGLELYYPLANRVFIGSKIKGALLANFFDSETRLTNDKGPGGVFVAGGSDDGIEVAGFGEIGTRLGFRVTDSITASVGYELWYLAGATTAYAQVPENFSLNQGSRVSVDEDVLFHGATAGVEIAF